MRVYDLNLTGAAAAETGRAQEAQRAEKTGAGGSPGGTAASGDRVELSSALGRLSEVLSAHGQERAARVQVLAAQYQAGNYRPDAAATAKGMVAEALAAGG